MPLRPQSDAVVWHVMNRGVEGRRIFGDESDKGFFLKLLGRFAIDEGVPVHTYTLMPNHFHLQVSAESEVLSSFAHRLSLTYVMNFNRRWERRGPLFQGRFHAVPIYKPKSALIVSCYVHQNPGAALLVRNLLDYPWTSYRYYVDLSSYRAPQWLDTSLILRTLGPLPSDAVTRYRRLIDIYRGDERDTWIKVLEQEAEQNPALGQGYYHRTPPE